MQTCITSAPGSTTACCVRRPRHRAAGAGSSRACWPHCRASRRSTQGASGCERPNSPSGAGIMPSSPGWLERRFLISRPLTPSRSSSCGARSATPRTTPDGRPILGPPALQVAPAVHERHHRCERRNEGSQSTVGSHGCDPGSSDTARRAICSESRLEVLHERGQLPFATNQLSAHQLPRCSALYLACSRSSRKRLVPNCHAQHD